MCPRILWVARITNLTESLNFSVGLFISCEFIVPLLQSSALLLILSGTACTMEVNGDDQVVAVEVQNICPVQMGNIRVSDLLAGLIQGKKNFQTSLLWVIKKACVYAYQCAAYHLLQKLMLIFRCWYRLKKAWNSQELMGNYSWKRRNRSCHVWATLLYLLVSAAPGGAVEKQHSRSSPAVCMRAEMGPSASRHSALADSSGYLDMRMQDCKAELLSSTVANIGPFLEDEFSVDGQPMKLHMRNIGITIKVSCSIWISTHFEFASYTIFVEKAFNNVSICTCVCLSRRSPSDNEFKHINLCFSCL